MNPKFKVLNHKDEKEFNKIIDSQWGCSLETDCAILKAQDDRMYLISKDINLQDLDKLKVNKLGLYIGKLDLKGFRLSIEGCQLIGKNAKKNVVELDKEETKKWITGNDLEIKKDQLSKIDYKSFLIMTNRNETTGKIDYLGCGKRRENEILNMVSKTRRINV